MEKLTEIRCGACQRKLGAGFYTRLEIKCPRCGAMNILRAAADHSDKSPLPERPGASNVEGNYDEDPKRRGAP